MERLKELQEWSIYEYGRRFFIEPESRHEMVMNKIRDIIKTYSPKVVVKAGLGSGKIILDLVSEKTGIYLVVVEPSLKLIEQFLKENSENEKVKEIAFVNGDFINFPVDYYAADLVISVDNLDVQETAPVIDEIKRILQFDAHFLFAGIVLDDDDIDGIYDDLIRMIFPLHNDYYLEDDLKTFLGLKEFSFIKGKNEAFEYSIDDMFKHIRELYGASKEDPEKFIEDNRDKFTELYKLSERRVKVPYFTGLFMRKKTG